MLDRSDSYEAIVEQLLDICPCKVALPSGWDRFFDERGLVRAEYSDRRRFPRVMIREQALLQVGKVLNGIYTSDVSHGGISFLHCEQLYPGDEVRIWRRCGAELKLVVARCLRHGPHCYECGAEAASDDARENCSRLVREMMATSGS